MKALVVLNLCYGVIRPISVVFCENAHKTIDNIVQYSCDFDFTFIINDKHSATDIELKYLPPHLMANTSDSARLGYIESKLKSNHLVFLNKSQNNAVADPNIFNSILSYRFEEISIGGFTATLDVMPTAIGLMAMHEKINVKADCTGDVSSDRKTKSLEHLTYIGIPIN